MKNLFSGFALCLVTVFATMVAAATLSQPNVEKLDAATWTKAVERPCLHPAGGWTEVDCSIAAAYSAELDQWSRYVVQANDGNAYWVVTTAASGQDADSADGYLPEGSWYEFVTDGTPRWISCDGSSAVSTVRFYQCK